MGYMMLNWMSLMNGPALSSHGRHPSVGNSPAVRALRVVSSHLAFSPGCMPGRQ